MPKIKEKKKKNRKRKNRKKGRKKRKKEIVMNIALLLITLIIFAILFEFFVRVFFPQNLNYAEFDTESGAGYKLRSNFHATYRTPEYVFVVDTNSNGFRDIRNYEYEKPENTKRIIVLGDSLVFGYTVSAEESYPKQLEQILKEENFNVEVINTGVPSYSTYKEMVAFENELYKYNPDVVIVGLCIGNDIVANIEDKERTEHVVSVLETKKPFNEYLNLKIRKFASSNLHSFQFIRGILISNEAIKNIFMNIGLISREAEFDWTKSYNPFINQSLEDDIGMNRTLEMLKELNEFTNKKNIKLVLVPIPMKELVDPVHFKEFWKKYENYSIDEERVEKYFEEFSAKNEIIYIDPLPELREKNINNSFYWEIDAHLNAAGYRVLAESTYEKLIKYYSFTT